MKKILGLFCILFIFSTASLYASQRAVTLQLPWHHQFQFAGYYAALEQGFYKDVGLNVTIKEGKPGIDSVDTVQSGHAKYGVGVAEVLAQRMQGVPVTVLASIFQHSAVIFLTKKESGISSPLDMAGRRVMLMEGISAAEHLAVFRKEGLSEDKIIRQPSSYDIDDLIDGKTDVFNAYSTNEPFYLKERNIPYTIIRPRDYGIDFYGDVLFTSTQELSDYPQQVKAFREASLQGWKYALDHPEEMIDLLLTKYGVEKTREHLQFEADAIRKLIMPDLVEIGHMNPGRWQHMADIFVQLGLAPSSFSLDGFVYDPNPPVDKTWMVKVAVGMAILCALYVFLILFFFNFSLKKSLRKRCAEVDKTEARFREVFNNMQDGVAIYEPTLDGTDFIFKDLNPAGQTAGQVQKEEVIGKSVREVFPGVEELGLFDVFKRVWQTGESENLPISLYKDDKKVLYVENYVCKLPSGEIVAVYADITKSKLAEEALCQKTEEWEKTFDAIPSIITLQDTNRKIIRANQAAFDFFQMEPAKLLGSTCHSLFRGTIEPCPGCPGIESFADNKKHTSIVEHKSLGKVFQVSSAPVFDKNNEVQYFVYIAQDITERKKLEEELVQAQKMEAIGTLAGGIAHDFNNILTAILGFAEIAKTELPETSQAAKDIDQVITAGERATELVKQILTFSRKTDQQKRPLRIDLIVKEALKMLRSSLPSTIDIQASIDKDSGMVLADPTGIHQIVVNLCTNASHAIGNNKGKLEVTLGRVYQESEQTGDKPEMQAGSFVVLTVKDSGMGMNEKTVARIFEPYFTTKEKGEGTGLGLAVIHGIVEEYNGVIEVKSTQGKGTIFQVYLPSFEEDNTTILDVEREIPLPTGNESILFVDDEPAITNIGRSVLTSLGYTVTAETKSTKALEKFQAAPETFDLVITDQTMPELTGVELARAMLMLKPDLPIILCTGYTSAISENEAYAIGIKRFVTKPLNKKKLAETVRRVLDENVAE